MAAMPFSAPVGLDHGFGHTPSGYLVELHVLGCAGNRKAGTPVAGSFVTHGGMWPRSTSPCGKALRSQESLPFAIASWTRVSTVEPPSTGAFANPTGTLGAQPTTNAQASTTMWFDAPMANGSLDARRALDETLRTPT
jgi:hypothetical protein